MDWTTYAQMKRATTARSALDWIALLCLLASGVFWFTLFWAVLVPPDRPIPQVTIAITMGMVYTLVMPLLWSILVPTTPAGMLLQKTQHKTWGFAVIIGAACFLTWHGGTLLRGWWYAQPNIRDAGQDVYLSVACIIAFVCIPALAWSQVTPDQWIAQIMQAREVTRLKHTLALEDMAMKAAHARALSIINAGLANATIGERKELAAILGASARAQRQAIEGIAYTFKDLYGMELKVPGAGDAEIAGQYKDVALLLSDGADQLGSVELAAEEADAVAVYDASAIVPHQYGDGVLMPSAAIRNAAATQPQRPAAVPQTAAVRRSSPQFAADYEAIRNATRSGNFGTSELATVIGKSERTALDRINAWMDAGLIARDSESKGRYYFTEREVAA